MKIKRWMQGLICIYAIILVHWCFPDNGTAEEYESRYTGGDISEVKENPDEEKKIALTFDDGPNLIYTPALLDGLKERDVHATFFLIGSNIEKEGAGEIVRRMYEEGHLIGNHTYHHVELTGIRDAEAEEEIERTSRLIEEITGEAVAFMRPPFGSWERELEDKTDLIPILWNVDSLDWTLQDTDKIVNKVVTEVEENDIILLHDCFDTSVSAALQIIDILQEEGYVFVTADELILH